MNRIDKKTSEIVKNNITLPTEVIKNKVLMALIDMFVHIPTTVDSENNRMLYSHRDTKLIKSAGGSVHNVC